MVHQFHAADRRIFDCRRTPSLSVSFIIGHVAESQLVDQIGRITRPTRRAGDRKGGDMNQTSGARRRRWYRERAAIFQGGALYSNT